MEDIKIDSVKGQIIGREKEMEKAAKMFESYFIFLFLKEMEKLASMEKKDIARDSYMTVLYEKIADFLSDRGLGIKEMIKNTLKWQLLKFYNEKGDNIIEKNKEASV